MTKIETNKKKPIIELKDICKSYGTEDVKTVVLKHINLQVYEGEFVAIMGPSGSGKSTLMNIMGFLDVPNCGEYFFEGKKVTTFDENFLADIRNKKIGFIFQSFYLLPRMTALDNVKLPMIYANIPSHEQQRIAMEILTSVGLGDRTDHRPNELSGGQQQRVAIARAMVNEPKILLADEPTGNIDTKSSKEIMTVFKKLNEEGHTLIIITHDKNVAGYANRVVNIKDGEIIKDEKRNK